MRKHFWAVALAGLLLTGTTTAKAWGPIGHRVVAEIAGFHLSQKARAGISAIIGNETLAMIANWPDFIKSDTTGRYKHTSPWHYLDFPGHCSRGVFDSIMAASTGENIHTMTLAMIKELKSPATSKDRKRFALSFLVHMIGDMHMPLHVGRDEDMGGNKIQVTWFDRPTNLHRVWDEHLIDFQQYSYTEYAGILQRLLAPGQLKQVQTGSFADWMWESHLVSDTIYDQIKPGDKLSYRYNFLFADTLNDQLLKGGVRLAKVLNEVFK
ncbi:S1/P1 Nuclease [Chitinophaga lutea]|uniref:S1/P1 Nuclease n=1 Tax=Chitinophaga lutea TaxID=2488634 RepID=A0A3N4PZJ6_9BACT|nr:S1/P1 nuclease [Chitinophaga lutea]RPE13388.1 S1/P1 Nuclease [Chitinophaga lutea]